MLRIHSGIPKLLCIHLSKTFVTLNFIIVITPNFLQNAVKFFVAVCIPNFFISFELIKWRLCQIHVSFFDQIWHKSVHKCQKQCTDMGSIHVGIGHDDNLVIT